MQIYTRWLKWTKGTELEGLTARFGSLSTNHNKETTMGRINLVSSNERPRAKGATDNHWCVIACTRHLICVIIPWGCKATGISELGPRTERLSQETGTSYSIGANESVSFQIDKLPRLASSPRSPWYHSIQTTMRARGGIKKKHSLIERHLMK